jgi:hypothetical protein
MPAKAMTPPKTWVAESTTNPSEQIAPVWCEQAMPPGTRVPQMSLAPGTRNASLSSGNGSGHAESACI